MGGVYGEKDKERLRKIDMGKSVLKTSEKSKLEQRIYQKKRIWEERRWVIRLWEKI